MHRTEVSSAEIGSLGVRHLKRYWWRQVNHIPLNDLETDADAEWALDRLVIHSLGIGLEQVARFLTPDKTFNELERWILALNGGSLNERTIRRINAVVSGADYDEDIAARLAAVESSPPVLTESDLERWRESGVVILSNAISPAECAAAAAVVFDAVGAEPNDPDSWYSRRNMQGIMVQIFQHPALEPARRSQRIHKAFAKLWGTADLVATTDRCGFNPPERPLYRFPGPYLHWDVDPTPPVAFGVHGILYLTDTEAEQGAFSCIPGFHRTVDEWFRELPANVRPLEMSMPLEEATPIAGRAGDLIIWHDALPHGSRPNRSSAPRVVQYMTMFPARRADYARPGR